MSVPKDRFTAKETEIRENLYNLFKTTPVPKDEILANLGLFIDRVQWGNFLFLIELYRQALDVQGIIAEFGVRWGRDLALFSALRGALEPYNHNRKIVGFDTFSGFPDISDKDGTDAAVHKGAFSVSEDYAAVLERILSLHEKASPISHIEKFDLRKGDVRETLDQYLDEHPETIFALAYFDLDLYEPTKYCLNRIRPHLTKGSIIGFDELNNDRYPGETIALMEEFDLNELRIQRRPYSPATSFFIFE